MDHKCEGCRYKSFHQEMMFRPFGVCTRGANLIEAEKNYNAEKCPYKKTNAGRIRSMSDMELAEFLADKCAMEGYLRLKDQGYEPTAIQQTTIKHALYFVWIKWLQQPAEDE